MSLIAAACFGQPGAAEALVNAGADVNAKLEGSPDVTTLQAAKSPMSQEDKVCLLHAFNGNEMDAEQFPRDGQNRNLKWWNFLKSMEQRSDRVLN